MWHCNDQNKWGQNSKLSHPSRHDWPGWITKCPSWCSIFTQRHQGCYKEAGSQGLLGMLCNVIQEPSDSEFDHLIHGTTYTIKYFFDISWNLHINLNITFDQITLCWIILCDYEWRATWYLVSPYWESSHQVHSIVKFQIKQPGICLFKLERVKSNWGRVKVLFEVSNWY